MILVGGAVGAGLYLAKGSSDDGGIHTDYCEEDPHFKEKVFNLPVLPSLAALPYSYNIELQPVWDSAAQECVCPPKWDADANDEQVKLGGITDEGACLGAIDQCAPETRYACPVTYTRALVLDNGEVCDPDPPEACCDPEAVPECEAIESHVYESDIAFSNPYSGKCDCLSDVALGDCTAQGQDLCSSGQNCCSHNGAGVKDVLGVCCNHECQDIPDGDGNMCCPSGMKPCKLEGTTMCFRSADCCGGEAPTFPEKCCSTEGGVEGKWGGAEYCGDTEDDCRVGPPPHTAAKLCNSNMDCWNSGAGCLPAGEGEGEGDFEDCDTCFPSYCANQGTEGGKGVCACSGYEEPVTGDATGCGESGSSAILCFDHAAVCSTNSFYESWLEQKEDEKVWCRDCSFLPTCPLDAETKEKLRLLGIQYDDIAELDVCRCAEDPFGGL